MNTKVRRQTKCYFIQVQIVRFIESEKVIIVRKSKLIINSDIVFLVAKEKELEQSSLQLITRFSIIIANIVISFIEDNSKE